MRIDIMHLARTYCILHVGLGGFDKFVTRIQRQYNLIV